jgi:hypothetical protein
MKCHRIVVLLALFCLIVSPSWGQTRSEEVQRLREQMESLQEKLKTMETGGPSSATRERTTQLGRSRIREEEPELVVRIYDLSDLLAWVNPYPATVASDIDSTASPIFPSSTENASGASGMGGMGGGMGGMGGMGGGMFSVPSRTPRSAGDASHAKPLPRVGNDVLFQRVAPGAAARASRTKSAASGVNSARIDLDALIDAITSTIESSTWDGVGGPGSIAPLGNSLIVSTAPKTHEQITALLDSFRKRWGTLRTVSVQANWLWLTDAQLAGLLAADGQAKAGEPRVFGLVSDAAWDAHIKALSVPKNDLPGGYQAVVTCYNGQTVHVVSGEQRRFVVGMTPVVGGGTADSPDGGVGHEPEVATLQEGAVLQVTPMTTTGGKFVVLDVHSRVVRLCNKGEVGNSQRIGTGSGVLDAAAVVDRPAIANDHLETTLRVPVDRRMLVGGMGSQAQSNNGKPGLYLFVKLGMQELRDDLPEAAAKTPKRVKP